MLGSSELAAWLDVQVFRMRNFPPSKSGLTACDYAYYEGLNPLTGAGNACMFPG
jgi:hypothetical protein